MGDVCYVMERGSPVRKRIGIFSGGGAKGLIQASCLAKLYGQGCFDPMRYDLFVGSSVGAINAVILAAGIINPKQLLKIYPDMLETIFKKRFLKVPLYDRENFKRCWVQYFPENLKLKDLKVKTMVTSVDVCSDRTHFFKSWEQKDGDLNLIAALERSFAAPYYFGQVVDFPDQVVWYDGGCGAYNLPIDFGYTEAILQGWTDINEITIDAFGTGFSEAGTPFTKAVGQGFLHQVWNYLFLPEGGMARAQSRDDQVRKMSKIASSQSSITFNYFDIQIPKKMDKMDDIKHMGDYVKFGEEMAERHVKLMPM
jgi:hypothetical protein